jgi:DeoR/GlpR family transcriptional regulator of sugar metabolism
MSLKEREVKILEFLKEKGEASIAELSSAMFVSEPTMRRDLAELSSEGKIIRTHGGAVYKSKLGENIPLSFREREHSEAKIAIAKKCLELISDGDVVMVDGSSTALALLSLLGSKKSIVVLTNSAKAAMILESANIRLFVTGGEIAENTYSFVGNYAEDFLRSFNADVCFFSVRTLTQNGLLTDNAIAENSIRRVMLSRSKKSVLMLDSKKLGEPCMNTLCALEDVSYVVSEKDISESFKVYKEKFL